MSNDNNKSDPEITIILSIKGQAALALLVLLLNIGFSGFAQHQLGEILGFMQKTVSTEKQQGSDHFLEESLIWNQINKGDAPRQ